MEYVNYTYDFDFEGFSLADLEAWSKARRPDDECAPNLPPKQRRIEYVDQSAITFSASPVNRVSRVTPSRSSNSDSRAASDADSGSRQSPWNCDMFVSPASQYVDRDGDEGHSRDGLPFQGAEEETPPRTLRRRSQNRTAQRNYRQRREDERKVLEKKLQLTEDECRDLGRTCAELGGAVETLREQLQRVEAENVVLWTSISSMPWRNNCE